MLSMTEKWKQALDNGKAVGVIFVDFQKAFESICHKKLSVELHASGISDNLREWVMNYLHDRKQYITINGEASENKQIEYDVPQGSLLGPMLYRVHANDLPDSSVYASIEMFADDSTAYYIGNPVDEVTPVLQEIINDMNAWSKNNSLTIHAGKTELMVITRSGFIGPLPNVTMDGHTINFVSKSTCLGMKVDT